MIGLQTSEGIHLTNAEEAVVFPDSLGPLSNKIFT